MSTKILVLPGWQGRGSDRGPMRWAERFGHAVVEQDDWLRPRRGDWLARLDEVVVDAPGTGADIVLVAHGLGCIQVAAWSVVSRHTGRIRGALLVAPTDVERSELREQIPGWTPIARQPLPFPAQVVGRHHDPCCSLERARSLAVDWGASWMGPGAAGDGHADRGQGDWPEGQACLQELMNRWDSTAMPSPTL